MNNKFISEEWDERIERLALGLEPMDAGRGTRLAHPIQVMFDGEARGLPRPRVERHPSCLHALRYQKGVEGRVLLRFVETGERGGTNLMGAPHRITPRRIVPRLISFPILKVEDTEEGAARSNYLHRVRRPLLFPGAAYDVAAGMTGLRGYVASNGQPVRWTRVVAILPGNGTVVGRAHGDDRGEFLLLILPEASDVGDPTGTLTIRVQVFARTVSPPAVTPKVRREDPLWDLPEEKAPTLTAPDFDEDEVSTGENLPENYFVFMQRDIVLHLGEIPILAAQFIKP